MWETAVVTVSDRSSRGERDDATGPAMLDAVVESGIASTTHYRLVADDIQMIETTLRKLAVDHGVSLILTCGGTGCSATDSTPEATRKVVTKEIPGLAELMRQKNSINHPNSWLSRGICGIYNNTIICNLPGSPGGAVESFHILAPLLPHALKLAGGSLSDCRDDCN
jgi:molybdopterin adenylyltransferase